MLMAQRHGFGKHQTTISPIPTLSPSFLAVSCRNPKKEVSGCLDRCIDGHVGRHVSRHIDRRVGGMTHRLATEVC